MSESTQLSTVAENDLPSAFVQNGNPFLKATQEAGVTSGAFMRQNGNTGNWIIGDQDDSEGGTFLFDLMGSKAGWLGFTGDNKPVRGPEVLLRSGEPLPKHPADDDDIRWNKQLRIMCIDPDTGDEFLLSDKADNERRPIWKLLALYGKKMAMHQDKRGYKMPLVTFSSRSFSMEIPETDANGKTRKIKVTKFAPLYEITDWLSLDEVDRIRSGEMEEAPDVKEYTHVEEANVVEIIEPQKKEASTTKSRFGDR